MNQILDTENDEWIYNSNLIKNQKNTIRIVYTLVIAFICLITIVLGIFFLKNKLNFNTVVEETRNNLEYETEKLYNEEDVVFKENVTCENGIEYEKIVVDEEPEMPEPEVLTSASGDAYSFIGKISIEKINLNMDIISKTTEELMNKSACKLWGADPNRVGNLCIIGHNWRNTKLFSKLPNLEIGDVVNITDLSERTITYEIYDKYTVEPEDTECLSQETEGKREVTLITCTNDSKQRYVFHAKEVL